MKSFTSGVLTATRKRNGKRQQKTFWQTLNPLNKNKQGLPKTRAEIMADLQAEAGAWQQET